MTTTERDIDWSWYTLPAEAYGRRLVYVVGVGACELTEEEIARIDPADLRRCAADLTWGEIIIGERVR
jgi:hypothetical protein